MSKGKKLLSRLGRTVKNIPAATKQVAGYRSTAFIGAGAVAAGSLSANAAAVDVTGIGTGLVTDIGTAGAEGLLVFGALFGIRVVIRAFASAAS